MIEDVIMCTIMGSVVLFIGIGIVWARKQEKKNWNNGVCPYCGKPWKVFDADSTGARGYKCENMHHCWISYNSIDRFFK